MPPTFGPPFASYQAEIFLRGLGGEVPEHPVALAELARLAQETADPLVFGYVAGGAGTEDTMRANEEAFRRWRIVPRMLRDVSARDLATTVLGTPAPAPVGLAPVGVQSIVHPDGELGTARAAAAVGLPMAVSTMSTTPLEDIAAAARRRANSPSGCTIELDSRGRRSHRSRRRRASTGRGQVARGERHAASGARSASGGGAALLARIVSSVQHTKAET